MDSHALRVLEFPRVRDLIATRCNSSLGRGVALELTPYHDAETLREVHAQLNEARAFLDNGSPLPVDGLVDIAAIINEAHDQKHPIEPGDFLRIHQTLSRARDLRSFVLSHAAQAPALDRLARQFLDQDELLHVIVSTIESPGVILDRASEKLWELRRDVRRTEDEIRERLNALLSNPRIRDAVQHSGFSLRAGRYVLPVKLDMKGHVPGILHDFSRAGSTAFIEPTDIVPLTNRLRELKVDQASEESRILWDLTRFCLARLNAIKHTANLLAWFEFTHAKAVLSRDFRMNAPELAEDGKVRLVQAVHPLLAQVARDPSTSRSVVPIDVRLRDGFRILIITGPNTGGKTVTLKTVGLLQLMFQSGLHVTAAPGSRLPLFRDIFADIGDEQSIDQNLSTFSGHVRNIATILESAGKGTLVLLDELGAGTDPAEGGALAEAILEELIERKCAVIVTTHIGALKQFAFSHAEVENACVEFDLETMSPTYRLLIGQPGNSNALHIARKWGVPEDILARARERIDGSHEQTQEFLDQLQKSRTHVEDLRRSSEAHLRRSQNLQKAAEEKLRYLEKREVRSEREAEHLIDETLKDLQARLATPLRELKSVPPPLRPALETIEKTVRDGLANTSLGKRRREFIAGLRKDDKVYVPKFAQVCRVKKVSKTEETLTLIVGQMSVDVGFDDISWLTPTPDV